MFPCSETCNFVVRLALKLHCCSVRHKYRPGSEHVRVPPGPRSYDPPSSLGPGSEISTVRCSSTSCSRYMVPNPFNMLSITAGFEPIVVELYVRI